MRRKKPDIVITDTAEESILSPNSVRGAQYIRNFITSNVTDLHYTDIALARVRAAEMRDAGLIVEPKRGKS